MRRFVVAVVAVVLLGAAGWIGTFFFGSPLVRVTMKDRAMDYLSARYPGTPFTYVQGSYDFLNHRYTALVRPSGDAEVAVRVGFNQLGQAVTDDYQEERMAREMERALAPTVRAALPEATVRASVVRADIPARVSLHISWMAPEAQAESFVGSAIRVMRALNDGGAPVANEYMFWCDIGGDRSYALTVTNRTPVTQADLLPLVARPGKW